MRLGEASELPERRHLCVRACGAFSFPGMCTEHRPDPRHREGCWDVRGAAAVCVWREGRVRPPGVRRRWIP